MAALMRVPQSRRAAAAPLATGKHGGDQNDEDRERGSGAP